MANHRIDRVGMEIKREVNEILRLRVNDPRVQDVTITDVQMLGDLSMAKVFYTIHSTLASDNQKAQIGLEKATGTIKRELGKNLTMYKIPDLQFVKDESMYQFWSRCEYEIILVDWPCQQISKKIDVHQQIMMNIDIVTNLLMEIVK